MAMEKRTQQAIVLRLDATVVDAIDEARYDMRLNRTQWLRKAIARNLDRNREELRGSGQPQIRAVLTP
jgi:hypothetical protein